MATRTQVQTAVYTALNTAYAGKTFKGMPSPVPYGACPFVAFTVNEPSFERMSMGTAGSILVTYDVDIWVIYGPPDKDYLALEAETSTLASADIMRNLFSNGLGLSEFYADVREGANNFETYTDSNKPPQSTYKLTIQDVRAANATADGG